MSDTSSVADPDLQPPSPASEPTTRRKGSIRRDIRLAITGRAGAVIRLGLAAAVVLLLLGASIAAWGTKSDVDALQARADRIAQKGAKTERVATDAARTTAALAAGREVPESTLSRADAAAGSLRTGSGDFQQRVTEIEGTLHKLRAASGVLGADDLTTRLGSVESYVKQAADLSPLIESTTASIRQNPGELPATTKASLVQASRSFTRLAEVARRVGPVANRVADRAQTLWEVLMAVLGICTALALAYLGRRIWLFMRWRKVRATGTRDALYDTTASLMA